MLINGTTVHRGKLAESAAYTNERRQEHVRVEISDTTLASPIPLEQADSSNSYRKYSTHDAKRRINDANYSGIQIKNGCAETILSGEITLLDYEINEIANTYKVKRFAMIGDTIAESDDKPIIIGIKEDEKYYFIGVANDRSCAFVVLNKADRGNKRTIFDAKLEKDAVDEVPKHLAMLIAQKITIIP